MLNTSALFQGSISVAVIFAAGLALYVVRHMIRMQAERMRFDIEKERREEQRAHEAELRQRATEERQLRDEEWRRTLSGAQNFYYFADHVEADPTATSGDYITIKFDLGAQTTAGNFADATYSALELPKNLAVMGKYDTDEVHVRVHRANYENPMTIILLITGGAAVLAYVMKKVRESNDDAQAIRASTSGTSTQVAADRLQRKLIERASDALEASDETERAEILGSINDVARALTEHRLLEMRPQQVGPAVQEHEPPVQRLTAAPPPRELGPGPSSAADQN